MVPNHPLVSIIVPCFNQAQWVENAIQSALTQRGVPVEVIAVNDGSTDDSQLRLARIKDSRYHWVQQDNQGLAEARNTGIATALGAYLVFLDADDMLHPDMCATHVGALRAHPRPAFSYSVPMIVSPTGVAQGVRPLRYTYTGNLTHALLEGGFFPPVCACLDTRALIKGEPIFTPGLGGHADFDLWLRLSLRGIDGVFVNEVLSSYRLSPTSMSTQGEHMELTLLASLSRACISHPELMASHILALAKECTNLGSLLQAQATKVPKGLAKLFR